jgi:hypothetical protein
MRTTLSIKYLALCLGWMLFALSGCKTEDVFPTVSIEASNSSFDFNGGTVQIFAVLNGTINSQLVVPIALDGSAVAGTDYNASATEIVIESGTDRGFITLTGIQTNDTTIKTVTIKILETERAVLLPPTSVTVELVNCSGDRDNDGIADCDDACPNEPGPVENGGCPWLGLIINEVHYDPAAGAAGDANGDGVRDPLADEFAELFNSNPDLDISGYTLSDAAMVRHTFPAGTIVPSKGAIVVFGGGNPTGTFGGSLVQTASEGQLNLNNAGDELILKDAQGNELARFNINGLSGNPDESYSRTPDVTGNFERHSRIQGSNGALYSPGVRTNGSNF